MMISSETPKPKTTLKIKLSTRRIEAVQWGHGTPIEEKSHTQIKKLQILEQNSLTPGANKRGLSGLMEGPLEKKQKMDRSMTQQCSMLLKSLMHHPYGWIFKNPVDPVKLNIPDYFSIISNPMDLGTVKSKLEKNFYVVAEEFAADVRLTFSNAMLYNPSTNDVHNIAKDLNTFFEERWKSLEGKTRFEGSKLGNGKFSNRESKEIVVARQNSPKTPPQHKVVPRRSKPSHNKIKPVRVAGRSVGKSLEHSLTKGICSGERHACGFVNGEPIVSLVPDKCSACGGSACQCGIPSNSTRASSDLSSERSTDRDQGSCTDASKLDCQAKSTTTSVMRKSDPDSDGAISALDDERLCPSSHVSTPATEANSEEEWKPLTNIPTSPSKALRAAILKERFADTILKAKHRTLLDNGDKTNPLKMQQERERLERQHREEKARIEAQIRAAEAASRRREEIEAKKQREREREAFRVALQKMQKTVQIGNLEVIKELEELGFSEGDAEGASLGSPLERLGLFRKDEYDSGVDEDEILGSHGDGEEGEISSP